jgi:ParB-like chromosome segregation protein Spo0J
MIWRAGHEPEELSVLAPEEEEINRQSVVEVAIDSLTFGDSPRRAGASSQHVEALTTASGPLPPIVVHRSSMRVIDGAHRVRAALLRGEKTIAARLFEGPDADAFVLSVVLNIAHGLPLARADRKRAAERIIVTHPLWSDRRVATVTGISPGTVAEIRKRCGSAAEAGGGRIGQDGRLRPLDGGAGRRLAAQLLVESPHLSLRQVARVAAISPETVRDVRNRLRAGLDLVPGGRSRGRGESKTPVAGGPASAAARGRPEALPDHAEIVRRLTADPSLRFTETGRNLLRLLSLHSLWTEDWEKITTSLPPHCSGAVADLAQQFADLWSELATRVGSDAA